MHHKILLSTIALAIFGAGSILVYAEKSVDADTASVYSCGDIIDADRQTIQLSSNISCSKDFTGAALTFSGTNSTLDFNGFNIDCVQSPSTGRNTTVGIAITGKNLSIENGEVRNCGTGIQIINNNSNPKLETTYVAQMSISGYCDVGAQILGNYSTIEETEASCQLLSNASAAEGITASIAFLLGTNPFDKTRPPGITLLGNSIKYNYGIDNDYGFVGNNYSTGGDLSNLFKRNIAENNRKDGFYISGSDQDFRDNISNENLNDGFHITIPNKNNSTANTQAKSTPPPGTILNRLTFNDAERNDNNGFYTEPGSYGTLIKRSRIGRGNSHYDFFEGNSECGLMYELSTENVWICNAVPKAYFLKTNTGCTIGLGIRACLPNGIPETPGAND